MTRRYSSLAIADAGDLVFGQSASPVDCGYGLGIGRGLVYPEVNFTLPPISIDAATWPDVKEHYHNIAKGVLRRAVALEAPGIVLEFELLPAMTETPDWGAEITALLRDHLRLAYERHGLKNALRVTPTDIRDRNKPPALRAGAPWERLRRSFDLCIAAGADIVSIESVGGKEVHDRGLMWGDIRAIVFALGVLAPRDVAWLWDRISLACAASGHAVPGSDTACGFGNTAMQLAHQKMLPETLAAVVRAMSAVRSLVAFEHGAIGPSKDCAYEGPILKAITGCPISMEGKSATCAHFSPVGNIAAAMCDLWSNESVQDVRLLAGSAPEAYTELLTYDCRLMNVATAKGKSLTLRDWLVESDEWLSPQAAVLSPEATHQIAQAIIGASTDYERTVAAGRAAVAILECGVSQGRLNISAREGQWLSRLDRELTELQGKEQALTEEMMRANPRLFDPASYDLLE
jgi:methanol--5-hydroxybenzimidazolylcobamide Co-methyltransferase